MTQDSVPEEPGRGKPLKPSDSAAPDPAAPEESAPDGPVPEEFAPEGSVPEGPAQSGRGVRHDGRPRHLVRDPAPAAVAGTDDGGTPGRSLGRQALAWGKEILTIIAIAVVLSFLIKTFLFRAFYIPSGSMENTLRIDDRIFVNLLVPKPIAIERGDVVVFKDTQGWLGPAEKTQTNWVTEVGTFIGLLPDNSQQHLVKRVIGLPGDKVACCSADGKLTINGQAITEPYLFPGADPSDQTFSVTVPAGHLWVMGDHRNNSQDSRYHEATNKTGFVPIDDVAGRAVVIAWPVSHWGILGNYPDVFRNVPAPEPAGASSRQPAPAAK